MSQPYPSARWVCPGCRTIHNTPEASCFACGALNPQAPGIPAVPDWQPPAPRGGIWLPGLIACGLVGCTLIVAAWLIAGSYLARVSAGGASRPARDSPKGPEARRLPGKHARIVWFYQFQGGMCGRVENVGSESLDHLCVRAYHLEPVYSAGFNVGQRRAVVAAAVEIVQDSGKPWDLNHPPQSIYTTLIQPGNSGGVTIGATQADLETIELVAFHGDREEQIPFTQEVDAVSFQRELERSDQEIYGRSYGHPGTIVAPSPEELRKRLKEQTVGAGGYRL